jgi:hypothetical protein
MRRKIKKPWRFNERTNTCLAIGALATWVPLRALSKRFLQHTSEL